MLPAMHSWPPNFFTPRRRPAESRPLRDEPPAFLCAIAIYSCARRLADRHDLDDRVVLAVTVATAIIVAAALLEDDDLLGLRLRHDFRGDGQAVHRLQIRSFT